MFNNKIIPQKYLFPINCVCSAVEAEQINMPCTCVKVSDFFSHYWCRFVIKNCEEKKFTAQIHSTTQIIDPRVKSWVTLSGIQTVVDIDTFSFNIWDGICEF